MKLELGKLKFEFKKELVPICVFYFFVLLCFGLIQPYFTLQLRTLGLTLDDAALVGESLHPHSWMDPFPSCKLLDLLSDYRLALGTFRAEPVKNHPVLETNIVGTFCKGVNPSLNLSNPVERWHFSFCRLYMCPHPWLHRGQGRYRQHHHSPCPCPLHWWSSLSLPPPSMTLKAL